MFEGLRESGPPSPDEAGKDNPDKKRKGEAGTLPLSPGEAPRPEGKEWWRILGATPKAGSDAKSKPAGTAKSNLVSKHSEQSEQRSAERTAEAILKGWPESKETRADQNKAVPEINETQAKNEFMKAGNAENILRTLENIDASAKINDTEEKYNFKCENKFLVNGQPAALENIRENLESGKINTNQISLDFQLEKVNGAESNHMKISVSVNDYLNGGVNGVRAALLKQVQNVSGAAKQGSESAAAARNTLTAQSAEAARNSPQRPEAPKKAAAGEKNRGAAAPHPQPGANRESLLVSSTPEAAAGPQVSASRGGAAIGPANPQSKEPGAPKEVINAIKGA